MKSFIVILLSLSTAVAWAIPQAPFDALNPSHLKVNVHGENQDYDFEGIIKLSNCSGSLVLFNGMPTTAKAVVMTNGHCIQKAGGFLSPGEVWVNKNISRALKVFDKNMKLHSVQATKILYATMTQTDVAFYELKETYDDIAAAFNVTPFALDGVHPVIGQSIDIVSGYWDRGYRCDIDSFIFAIREDAWTWSDSIRYTDTCDTIGGTSGSPLIARTERRVIGINNTSNEDGKVCAMNNPCEVNEDGEVFARQGVRYGQQTFNVYTCLTPDFKFDVTREGCTLPR